MRGLFVTGTGTSVGKTVVSAALLAAMRAAGERVGAHKPVITGLDEPPGKWPADHDLLAAAAGMDADEVAPLRYGPAVSPHLASALAGQPLDGAEVGRSAQSAAAKCDTLIVEGVGGLLVPIADDYTVCDLAVALALPVIIAATPGLGTINHTLLTIEAARAAGLGAAAVVLTPWPAEPSEMELSNRKTIARLGEIEVAGLRYVTSADIAELALAGADLPWQGWLSRTSSVQ